jgi:hypothetical protein
MQLEPNYIIWGAVSLLLILNLLIYFHDPLIYANPQKCFFLQCRKYSLVYALVILGLDLCLVISLTHLAGPPYLPTYWYIPFAILAVLIILMRYNETQITAKEHRFTPLPLYFFRKNGRIIIRSIILALYLIILLSRYLTEALPTIPTQSLPERFFYNRFGGLTQKNSIIFLLSILTVFSIPIATFRLYQEITFHPTIYNLPLAWHR